ncbi:MAG: hypothetical protein JXR94_04025 [Candidatus Hydrogenedentes bacterium]|nr:hypothetical protein [Candidatus Hydrogenedentota bacterium]
MDVRTRFQRLMRFEPVDRLPLLEWATWWDKTIERWHGEGLPPELVEGGAIRDYFGQDAYRQTWIPPRKPSCPAPAYHGAGILADLQGYEDMRPHLYPDAREAIDTATLESWAERQARGEMVVWLTLEGFFWYPRTLLGIQRHLCAFYEQPETLHAMNRDLLEFNLAVLEALCAVCTPDFVTFAEDMAYRSGPMISRALFDEFQAPYYRRIVPQVLERGIIPFVDSDGRVEQLIRWFLDVGIDGFLPLERQAGCDVAAIRAGHPGVRFIGGYDKMCMTLGEAAMRAEFDRLLPVLRQGGFLVGVDHQTPPAVPLDAYRVYLRLLEEYAIKAAAPPAA